MSGFLRRLWLAWHYVDIAESLMDARENDLAECYSIRLVPVHPSKAVRVGTNGKKAGVTVWVDGSTVQAWEVFRLLTGVGQQVYAAGALYDTAYNRTVLITQWAKR